ncbi:SpaH/EbpB family LPXTG-anchored major pilin [Coprococcus comes]|jgi:fimbrial isopeptide formation D2 family protein/LPXTG-motif cell wall-anchored protein|uniref:SpaH/EbpB family LPXTG-anchored major pilin n=1 Tax=Lachnospiraceae TaxID=186803 RepID=UPI001570EBD3|nr:MULTISPECIES: SpaH/EbpB family LPXTG-anchored major pilin [Lachnospiraceae]NSE42659.1 SpaH/EbpB family LPXTG-anchored major pilin [Dorea longicatena]NSE81834.1 SpaH/EbpB family LPXTG-anchored major pilin [Coprococcus comes]NSE84715.1 SpaH/EbpB family LPXTG-anchored major pilin [Coprococcus comes]NSF22832.1 SpaH/EbpB family LPXTG-anchored major pilin [Coprococcus comes]
MKRMKRIMALMLAAIMMMAMSVTAFAAGGATGTHTLTVNVKSTTPAQDLKGQTINLYKLFDVTESKSGETTNYAYTVNNTYKATLASVLKIGETAKDEEYAAAVLALKDTEGAVQKFANDFTAEALTKKLSATANSGKITEENKTSYTFENLAAGYYLVYVTGGKEIQSSLVTVDETTTTVNLKTEAPSITKTADKETAEIGQVVKYTVTGAIPDTTGYEQYQYIIHDELSKGLDFVNDAKGTALEEGATTVTVAVAFGEEIADASKAPTTATLDSTNKKKMSLDLSEWVRANQTNKGKAFTVTYYAKVNKDAVVTEKNNAQLEYGNNPKETTKTTPSEAKTPTYPLDILKKEKTSEKELAGAKFSLYTTEADAKAGTNAITVSGSDGKYVVDPTSKNTVFESVASIEGENYNLHVNGLKAGDYWLVETEAPAGYNKLTAPIKVTIKKSADADVNNWTISKDGVDEKDKIIDIENSTGSLLPSTGGRGAIAFAVIAALLVFGVAVSFIRDKRKEA